MRVRSNLLVICSVLGLGPACVIQGAEPTASMTIHVDQPGISVSPLLYGIFFEEINRAGDGGLYAEMVQNRAFEDDPGKPVAWSLVRRGEAVGNITLDKAQPLNNHTPTSLRLEVVDPRSGCVGAASEGFQGIAVQQGGQYRLSFYARCSNGSRGLATASLETPGGEVLAVQEVTGITPEWQQFRCTLKAAKADSSARLVIGSSATGVLWLDVVSLFPQQTYQGHACRTDLAQMLKDMNPAFVRFPGGCYVEGDELANAFRWKDTIGDVAKRPGHWNLWGYRSNDGLGYLEYLQLCQDLGTEPLFVINCGMAHKDVVPLERMQEFVQDALDAIEYANGDAGSTKWGKLRAEHGHPAPFGLKYIEIGNENGGPAYDERYALFYDAIKATYPDIKIVANVPTRQRPTEILDEHYYSLPEFFMANAFRYDTYDRKGSHIYVGEYAVTQNAGQGNLRAAVGEAAFMTGMERNADVVVMSSYAPLFVNPGWRRWNPNAIVFDASRCYGTPSYHVQSMFARHRSDVVLPLELKSPPLSAEPRSGRIGIGTWATQAEFKDIQVVRDGKTLWAFDPQRGLQEWEISSGDWEMVDGALRQTSPKTPACVFTGERDWTEYTIQLKARKLSGAEGFLISFLSQDPNGKSWWNLGGWGNREHGIESDGVAASHVAGQIETGRWYDIRIEVKGSGIRCFLDDQLVQEVKQGQLSALYAVAGSKRDTGEVILKVVCASNEPQTATISLAGASKVAPQVPVCVLTSKTPEDENSFEEPTKVVPQETTFQSACTSFDYTFPPNSVTIMRIKVEAPARQ